MRNLTRLVLLATMLLAVGLQIGCGEWTAEDKAFVKDLAQEWLRSKDMSPTDENGNVDWMGSLRFGQALIGQSDDEDANAVLGAYGAISGVIEGDKLMEKGRTSGDAGAMDAAIAARPQDWTYRSSRSVLALAQGDMQTYASQGESFYSLAEEQGVPPARLARQTINDYQAIAVSDKGEQGYHKYMDLYDAYATLYEETGNESYATQASAAAMAAESARE